MANASGTAMAGFISGGFTHSRSEVTYHMEKEGGRAFLSFEREPVGQGLGITHTGGAETSGPESDRSLKGRRELRYFVGSGKRGRTYLFEQDSYWFETPINWYAKKRVWDMAPNYQGAAEMPLTLPVDPGCLRCHASGVQSSLPEARNRYLGSPFREGGITCTACHGDASSHLLTGGQRPMAHVEALPPVDRDSICLSCHLEGQEAVVHLGKKLEDFRPGESIFDYASYFVRDSSGDPAPQGSTERGSGARATSQWEALLRSGCKKGSGDKLTCTTCHDPHGSTAAMSAKEQVNFYRERCLQCHNSDVARSGEMRTGTFAATHHPENRDCTSCHMPKTTAEDIAHEQVTDHEIPRIPMSAAVRAGSSARSTHTVGTLVAVARGEGVPEVSGNRDLGLAYALAAVGGDRKAADRARELLQDAEKLPESASDRELHTQLGFLDQLEGENDPAEREYELALKADPHDSVAEGNLALLKVRDRQFETAIALLERAFEEDPTQLTAGMNLAIVECDLGRREAALGALNRVLEFSPDNGQARVLSHAIRLGRHRCGAR
jgi:predicted CXXCH cytochrome family protein